MTDFIINHSGVIISILVHMQTFQPSLSWRERRSYKFSQEMCTGSFYANCCRSVENGGKSGVGK